MTATPFTESDELTALREAVGKLAASYGHSYVAEKTRNGENPMKLAGRKAAGDVHELVQADGPQERVEKARDVFSEGHEVHFVVLRDDTPFRRKQCDAVIRFTRVLTLLCCP